MLQKQLTIWQDGCEEKLINEMMSVSWRFISVMALIIIAMASFVLFVGIYKTSKTNLTTVLTYLLKLLKIFNFGNNALSKSIQWFL